MASVSYSLTRGTMIDTLAAGSQTVTVGSSAPGAGDMEIRIDLTKNFTKKELRIAFGVIWKFLSDSTRDTSIPL